MSFYDTERRPANQRGGFLFQEREGRKMGILDEIGKGIKHSYEVNKAFLWEASIESIPIVGPALLQGSGQSDYQGERAEIKVKGGLLDMFSASRCRANEIGTLRDEGIEVLGYTKEGFLVREKDRASALAILRSTGLKVE